MPDDLNKTTYTGRKRAGYDKVGVCKFNPLQFTVDDSGEVSLIGGGAAVDALAGDSGTAVPNVAGVITVAGGTNLTTVGATNTLTVNMDAAISLATSVTSPLYLAPAATAMEIRATAGQNMSMQMGDAAAANKVSFEDSASVEVAQINSDGNMTALSYATSAAAAGLTISGDDIDADGTDVDITITVSPKGTGDFVVDVGDIQATAGDIIAFRSAAAADVTLEATNSDNTSGTSRAGVEIATGGASSGDPYLRFEISGVGSSTMTMGLDNSASDLFVISNSNTIGTSNALSLSQAGALTATTTLTATLGAITATAGNFVSSLAGNGLLFNANTATGAAASPVVLDSRAGQVVFTSVSIAAAADLTLTITNSAITGSSTQVIYSMSGSTTGSAPSIKSVTNTAGSSAIVVTNGTGATTTTADITLTFIVVN